MIKTITRLTALLYFSLLANFSLAQPAPLELIQIQDDLYVIHNPGAPGNITVLVSDEGLLLVDSKFAVDYDNVMAMIRTISDQPVKYVVSTHYHGDHTGGNAQAQADGSVVIASENARIKMVETDAPGKPDIGVTEHAFVHLGGKVAEIIYFGRSHTDGDVVVYFPDHGAVTTGDMFNNRPGVSPLIDYSGGGSIREWTRTVDRVLALEFDMVIPGHGRPTVRSVVEDFRELTLEMRIRTRDMISEGRSREEIANMLRAEYEWTDLLFELGFDGLLGEARMPLRI